MKEEKEEEQELIRTESNDYEIDNETKPRGESTQTIHFEYREVYYSQESMGEWQIAQVGCWA